MTHAKGPETATDLIGRHCMTIVSVPRKNGRILCLVGEIITPEKATEISKLSSVMNDLVFGLRPNDLWQMHHMNLHTHEGIQLLRRFIDANGERAPKAKSETYHSYVLGRLEELKRGTPCGCGISHDGKNAHTKLCERHRNEVLQVQLDTLIQMAIDYMAGAAREMQLGHIAGRIEMVYRRDWALREIAKFYPPGRVVSEELFGR